MFRLGTFESLTNVRDVTYSRAVDSIKAIALIPKLSVPKIKQFADHLRSRVALTKKLAAAGRLGTLKAIKADALAERIDELDVQLKVEESKGVYTIHVDPNDPEEMKQFVEVITDVYLLSPMTQLTYKTGFKELATLKNKKS